MSIKVFIPFEDPAQHLFDTTKIEVAEGVGRLKSLMSESEVAYWNFDEDGSTVSRRGAQTIELPDFSVAIPNVGVVQNGYLEFKNNDQSFGNVDGIAKVDSGNNPAFSTKVKINLTTVPSDYNLVELTSNANSASILVYLSNQGGGVTRIRAELKNNSGTVLYSGILGTRTFAIDDVFEVGFSREVVSGNYYFTLDGVKINVGAATLLFDVINLQLGGPHPDKTNWSYKDIQIWNGLDRIDLAYDGLRPESYSYSTTYQTMITVAPLLMDSFVEFLGRYRNNLAGEVMHQLMLNSKYWWYNTTTLKWEEVTDASNLNTPEELSASVDELELEGGIGKYIQLVTQIKSSDGYNMPEILDAEICYKFYFGLGAGLPVSIIYGSIVDSSGRSVANATIKVWGKDFFHGNTYVTRNYEYITNTNGKWDLQIVETESVAKTANITITYTDTDGKVIIKDFKNLVIENVASKSFSQLLIDNGVSL